MSIVKWFKSTYNLSSDYIFNDVIVSHKKISIIYNEVLCDTKSIDNIIMYRLLLLNRKELDDLENNIPYCNTKIICKEEILDYLNNGFLIIIYKNIYAFEIRSNLDRGVNTIESELSLSGPKDSFSEVFNTNLGLIRKRIKSSHLKMDISNVGRYTKNKIGILYIDNICKKSLIDSIIKKLNKIDIDGIIDSSYLKYSLEDKYNLFPTIITTERPDKCCMALLEGKVIIIVDNSPYCLILPSLFLDFFHTTDDYFQKPFNTTFIRIIRLLAFFIAIFTPAIYISVTTRNYDLIPTSLLIMLKAGRTFVPFPAYIEALFMIVCFEILKESDLRMSNTSGSSISILGGLILGDCAVAAGIVSPIMIIVIAISSIAGLIFSSIELVNTLRTYKLLLLILGTLFGIYGVIMGFIFMIYNICSTRVFGYSYLSFDKNEVLDSFIKIDKDKKYRNSKLTDNTYRGKYR